MYENLFKKTFENILNDFEYINFMRIALFLSWLCLKALCAREQQYKIFVLNFLSNQ